MKVLAVLLAVTGLTVTAPLKVTLTAPTHTPTINTHWNYTVRATQGGKTVAGKITAQIVDPIGGVHPVEYGANTTKIVNRPFSGVFRDYIIWLPESRGVPLTFRITVLVGRARKVVAYQVVPQAAPSALKVTLNAPTRTPKIGTRWPYTVQATRGGKAVAGTITVQTVDPLGGVHPVQFGTKAKAIVKQPFKGVFSDFVVWPPESKGITLKLRVTVVVGKARKVLVYAVVPRAT